MPAYFNDDKEIMHHTSMDVWNDNLPVIEMENLDRKQHLDVGSDSDVTAVSFNNPIFVSEDLEVFNPIYQPKALAEPVHGPPGIDDDEEDAEEEDEEEEPASPTAQAVRINIISLFYTVSNNYFITGG